MPPPAKTDLETRIVEALMRVLFPCDLGDGIEVVHDVEVIDLEMDCDLGDDGWYSAPYERLEIQCEPAVVVPAPASVSPREVAAALNLDAFERSTVWDTLPFAKFEPDVRGSDSQRQK